MLEKLFSSPTQWMLNKSMDVAALRNEVIADNIANVDTPKFKRREVIFEENLKKALQSDSTSKAKLKVNDNRHFPLVEESAGVAVPEIRVMEDLSYRNDENNVDIDVESAKLAKNKIMYDAVSQSMGEELTLLRLAITGRG
ncbi:MAG: flagellar basal body rod protein FlgB [Deltaproteobacteria bacterium]